MMLKSSCHSASSQPEALVTEGNTMSGTDQCGRPPGRGHNPPRSVILSEVDAATCAGLAHCYLAEMRQHWPKSLPYPAGEVLARRIGQTLDLVQIAVVQLSMNRLKGRGNVSKVHDPAGFGLEGTSDVDLYFERVPVHPGAFMAFRDIGQPGWSFFR